MNIAVVRTRSGPSRNEEVRRAVESRREGSRKKGGKEREPEERSRREESSGRRGREDILRGKKQKGENEEN